MKHCRTLVMEYLQISGTDFSYFECMHVLALRNYDVIELPVSIKKLIHLRKLDISYTSIISLPDWIGEFHYLQTLRAESYNLKKLPSTIKYLTNMRHLYLAENKVLPAGIGGLTCLQTLRYFGVRDENDGCKIEELGGLNDLKGKLEVRNLERVRDKEEAVKANLFRKSKIMELGLRWDRRREYEIANVVELALRRDKRREGEIGNYENVLEGLQPHADLKKLSIWGFKGRRFPAWTMKMAVQNVPVGGSWIGLNKLTDIEPGWCTECEEIPMLGHLPNLKTLKLQRLSNVKRINSSACGIAYRDTRIVFPALETLWLDDVPKLARVESDCGSDVQVLPRLQCLFIYGCEQLMSFGTHSLPCLKYLSIASKSRSTPAPNIFHIKYMLLTGLSLLNLSDLECLPDMLFNEIPNLSELEISNCPKLRELPPGLLTLTSSLQELRIEDCPLLERIAGVDGGEESQSVGSIFFFTSLREITIERCGALLWLPRELVGPSLEKLYLVSLKSLKNLPSLIDCMARSSRLTFLSVDDVPKFMATSRPVEGWCFGSLRKLRIDASVEGSMETVDGFLQGCQHSLEELKMRGTEYWNGLPESIQCLTGLRGLELKNCGMEELPEWLGNLSSLVSLNLCDCKRLRRLPSMDAMTRLQRLRTLTIKGCPELLAQGVADPEWPKVAHLNYVSLDDTRLVADSDTSRESRWKKLKRLR